MENEKREMDFFDDVDVEETEVVVSTDEDQVENTDEVVTEEVVMEEAPASIDEKINSDEDVLEFTLDELESLVNSAPKRTDPTNSRFINLLRQKKLNVIDREVKGRRVYIFTATAGNVILQHFVSGSPQHEVADEIERNPIVWNELSAVEKDGYNKVSYEGTCDKFGKIYFTKFVAIRK